MLDRSRVAGCDVDEKLSCLRPRRSARTAASLDLGLELLPIAEGVDLTKGETVEAQTSSCCADGEFLTQQAISGLSMPPIQVGSDSPPLLPLPMSAKLLRGGSEPGKDEMGEGAEGYCPLDGVVPSVQVLSSSFACAVESVGPASVLKGVADGELLSQVNGGDLAGEQSVVCLEAAAVRMRNCGASLGAFGAAACSKGGGDIEGDGGGHRGGSSADGIGRTYAQSVGIDKRSDVRLRFVPVDVSDDGVDLCVLVVRQSPSPVWPRSRRAPLSPGPRGRRHHRPSSPTVLPFSDLDELSSSEQGDSTEENEDPISGSLSASPTREALPRAAAVDVGGLEVDLTSVRCPDMLPLSPSAGALVHGYDGDGDEEVAFSRGTPGDVVAAQGISGKDDLVDAGVIFQSSGDCLLGGLLPTAAVVAQGNIGGAVWQATVGLGGRKLVADDQATSSSYYQRVVSACHPSPDLAVAAERDSVEGSRSPSGQ
ncbi:hypothetical protein Dimus_013536, partial [Dionaea muscipula]